MRRSSRDVVLILLAAVVMGVLGVVSLFRRSDELRRTHDEKRHRRSEADVATSGIVDEADVVALRQEQEQKQEGYERPNPPSEAKVTKPASEARATPSTLAVAPQKEQGAAPSCPASLANARETEGWGESSVCVWGCGV